MRKNLKFIYNPPLKLFKITFLLIKIKMSRLHHIESLEYPVKGKLMKNIWKIQNKTAHGGNYVPIFPTITFGGPLWNSLYN